MPFAHRDIFYLSLGWIKRKHLIILSGCPYRHQGNLLAKNNRHIAVWEG
jgi:hypothetical protein